MANKRSEYIQQLMSDQETLSEALKNIAKENLRSLMDESLKKNIRQMISEGDDYEEDEADDPTIETSDVEKSDDTETDVDVTVDDKDGEESTEIEADAETDGEESEIWDEIDNLKGEDGAYDCTGMDQENLVKVFQQLKPEDGVTVVRKDNGTVELTDQETEKTYVIDMDTDPVTESKDSDFVIDDYQKDTAMTTLDNHEPADSSKTYSMDGGVPTGTEKPFPGNGDNSPFSQEVSESDETFEVELGECDGTCGTEGRVEEGGYSVSQHSAQVGSTTNSQVPNTERNSEGRNSHEGGEQVHSTSENPYSVRESRRIKTISAKANEIFNENKQMRQVLKKLYGQLQEAMIYNKNIANFARLVTENSTTRDEKKSILVRFNEAKSLEASDNLYKVISEELKRRPTPQVAITESVNNSTTTQPLYQSNEITEFMKRMDKVKNR